MEFKKENKYLVLKLADVRRFLNSDQKAVLEGICETIDKSRHKEGKKDNSYVVVNEDEPYAETVWKLIEVSQTNPEGLKILLENLKVELLGY